MATTHVNESIDEKKELHGNSRRGGDAPPEVQQKVIDLIIEEARKLRFDNRDIAYYIAIAKRESEFNPDAANSQSTAAGVAQMQDETGKSFGVNDSNRFDARTSIKAGLEYFAKIKKKIINDFGSASSKYETLIYYSYHYGEYSVNRRETINGKVVVKEALPFSQLEGNKKYEDSKTVVDEAARIEKILNDTHGLKIQLADILGKPMAGRKGIVIQKIAKPAPAPAPAPAPTVNAPGEPEGGSNGTPVAVPEKTSSVAPISACEIDQVHVTWELIAYEVVTDGEGNFPEINSESQEPFVLLIPRFEYDFYNKAVANNEIPEDGNQHELFCRNESISILPAIKTPVNEIEKKVDPKSIPPKKLEASAPKAATANIFAASEKGAQQGPPQTVTPSPSISFNDVVIAVKKDLGWANVYATSFAYAKQFFTRPKLPDKPLDENTKTQKSAARTQSIGSSLKNQDTKPLQVKDKVTTAEQPPFKKVEVIGDAPWMVYAIKEQTKSGAGKVEATPGSHRTDPKWKEEHSVRTEAEKLIKVSQTNLAKETHKPEKTKDIQKINELELKINEQKKLRDQADKKMQEIEKNYNNADIVKYLQSTTLDRDMARDEETAWCYSFANWCVEAAGYHGTGGAKAESWKKWGEKIDEPRYGAVTITTRASNPEKYHVGFYTGIQAKSEPDGTEEVAVKGKNGEIKMKVQKKYKKVESVRLLSGNMTGEIKELADWTVNATDNATRHLVEYRWPTTKERK